jgi:hypothetical protein
MNFTCTAWGFKLKFSSLTPSFLRGGPFTSEEMQELIGSSKICGTTTLWHPGMPAWRSLAHIASHNQLPFPAPCSCHCVPERAPEGYSYLDDQQARLVAKLSAWERISTVLGECAYFNHLTKEQKVSPLFVFGFILILKHLQFAFCCSNGCF